MSTLSLDDAAVIRRLKNHVVQCRCCQAALRKEEDKDDFEEPTLNHPDAEGSNHIPSPAQPGKGNRLQ
jgi:hypothetical protein